MQIVIFVECQIYIWKPDVILSHFKLSRCVFFYCETEQNTSSNSPTNTILLPSSPPLWHPQILIRAQNQKSPLTFLFAWSNPFQNGKTSPSSPKNHGPARFQGKGLGAGQGLLQWGLGSSTTQPKVTCDQPSNPWKFCSNWSICSKVIHGFL